MLKKFIQFQNKKNSESPGNFNSIQIVILQYKSVFLFLSFLTIFR